MFYYVKINLIRLSALCWSLMLSNVLIINTGIAQTAIPSENTVSSASATIGRCDIQNIAADTKELDLTAEERAFLDAHPVLRVSNEVDWPPYDYFENGIPKGYSIDLMKQLESKIGVRFEFVQGASWDELVDQLCAQTIDLLHPADQPTKLLKCANFSLPILQDTNQFVTRRDYREVRLISDLFGSIAAFPKGWETTERLKSHYSDQFTVIETENIAEAIAAVSNGRADFTSDFANVLNYYITRLGYVNLKIQGVWSQDNKQTTLRIATRNDWPILQSIIDKALASLDQSKIQRLQDTWFNETGIQSKRIALAPEQLDYLRRKGPVKLCVDPDWMPVEYLDEHGIHQGILAEIIANFAERLGVQLVVIPTTTWQESLKFMQEGHCDLLSGAIATPSRQAYLNFTTPYLTLRSVIATRIDQVFIDNVESVINETFGITRGYAMRELLIANYPKIRLREVADAKEGLQYVRDGRLFGFIDTLPTIAYNIQTQATFDIKIAGQLGDGQNLAWNLALATHRDNPVLTEIFQAAIDATPYRHIQEIVNRWLSLRYEKVFDYVLMWQIIAAVVGLAGMILWVVVAWNRRLTRLNRELNQARAYIAAQNVGLEQRVAERTQDLQQTLSQLEQTRASLVQSEKLAALGDLVAGIAHELNTPIGNAVLLASTLSDQERAFREKMVTGLSRSALQGFIDAVRDSSNILLRSLQRAAELISSFKQVAVDQASYQRRPFTLEEIMREIVLTLQPRLRHSIARLEVCVTPEVRFDSFPGPLGQVLINLIQNAQLHAFEGRTTGQIRIESQITTADFVVIRVSDDGNGIPADILGRIFDPFFTTRLGQGGSGLGLHIVYNLVTGLLGGAISVQSIPGQGSVFELTLPLIAPSAVTETSNLSA